MFTVFGSATTYMIDSKFLWQIYCNKNRIRHFHRSKRFVVFWAMTVIGGFRRSRGSSCLQLQGRIFLQNVGNRLQSDTVTRPRRPQKECNRYVSPEPLFLAVCGAKLVPVRGYATVPTVATTSVSAVEVVRSVECCVASESRGRWNRFSFHDFTCYRLFC
jgi:hypothetical protein